MDDKFVSLEEIKKELLALESEVASLSRRLNVLSEKIKYIFSQIKNCDTLEQANDYFDLLDSVQLVLAKTAFNEDIGLPERLRRFVRDFDNLEFYKEHYFFKIKNEEYLY